MGSTISERRRAIILLMMIMSIAGMGPLTFSVARGQQHLLQNQTKTLFAPFVLLVNSTQQINTVYRYALVHEKQTNLNLAIQNPNGGTLPLTFNNLTAGQDLFVTFDSYYAFNKENPQIIPFASNIVVNLTQVKMPQAALHVTQLQIGNATTVLRYTNNGSELPPHFIIPRTIPTGTYLISVFVYFPGYDTGVNYVAPVNISNELNLTRGIK